jgi:N-acetylglutamate synthase
VELHSLPTPEWLSALARCQRQNEEQRGVYRQIVEALVVPSVFAAIRHDGQFVSLARGAIHNRLVCLESVVTDPSYRHVGFARRTVSAILTWARGHGAQGACVQVEANNMPAIALYTGVGLRAELYRYRYRREPMKPPAV